MVPVRSLTPKVVVALALVAGVVSAPVRMAWSAPRTRLATLAASAPGGAGPSFPATHAAVTWTGDDDAAVELRWQGDDRAWRPWAVVETNGDMTDRARRRVFSSLIRVADARRFETRLIAGEARAVRVVAIDVEHGPRHLVRAAPRAAEASTTDTRVAQPAVVTRAEWGADQCPRGPDDPAFAPISKLIVHHTDTANDDPDPAGTVRAICVFHTQSRGWNDIGYNFLVDAQGRIYEGRYARDYAMAEVPTGEDLQGNGVIGAHAIGANTGSVGVALLGNFETAPPAAAAVTGLERMLAWKADRHDIDPMASPDYVREDGSSIPNLPNISGHRDSSSTGCPGDALYARLPGVRQDVANVIAAARGSTVGYWVTGRAGAVYGFGQAPNFGEATNLRLTAPVIGMAGRPTHAGYWLLGGDGGIFSYGDAQFWGSTGAMKLNKPVVGMAATPSGNGYWLVASDGGIFAFGDAPFWGSTGAMTLNKPVVGMAPTPTGRGYWLVASDGGVFAFGDAQFRGSTGGIRLNSPVAAMAAAATGAGYWLIARDGGVFAFDVPFKGSVPGLRLASYAGSVSMRPTATSRGYYVLGADGGIFTFGDARFFGAHAGLSGPTAAADLALNDSVPST